MPFNTNYEEASGIYCSISSVVTFDGKASIVTLQDNGFEEEEEQQRILETGCVTQTPAPELHPSFEQRQDIPIESNTHSQHHHQEYDSNPIQTEVTENKKSQICEDTRRKKYLHLAVLNFTLILASIVYLAILISQDDNEEIIFLRTNTDTNTNEALLPSSIHSTGKVASDYKILRKAIAPFMNDPTLLIDSLSAQSQAILWLMQQDTFLNLDQDYVHLTNGHFIRQRFAMMVLFFSCGGIFWEIEENDVSIPIDWAGNASEGECDWPLVQCDQNNMVVSLSLHGVGMTSSIPNEIGMITTLKTCIFGKNRLEGTLPPSFFELTSLRMLDINSNDYYGSLPSALGYLTNLEDLQLDNNLFRGEIPVSFTNLSNLKSFHIENNREITGPILDMATWSWPRITLLSFSNTAITGTVPTTIGLLTDLAFLYAGDSTIRGSIPSEMGLLTKLSRLRLSGSIEGTLPSTIQNCASLVDVDLLFNDIIGTLPPDLSRLAAIEYIFLGRNKLMGTLPPEWKDLDNLVLLSLQRNNLSGSIPENWSSLTKLKVLSIHENPAMTGTIPSALCSSVDTIQWGCNLVCDCCASDCIQPKD